MSMGWDRPQEDEFALCFLGAGSPYEMIAFPNRRPPSGQEFLDLASVSRRELRQWQRTLDTFLRMVTFRNPRRLVLKSPPHTARIKILQEMFPGALFLHIVRDPYVVFPSTVNLWKSLAETPASRSAASASALSSALPGTTSGWRATMWAEARSLCRRMLVART